jgi:hypothetical protein
MNKLGSLGESDIVQKVAPILKRMPGVLGVGAANVLGGGLAPTADTSSAQGTQPINNQPNQGIGNSTMYNPTMLALQEAMGSPALFSQIGNILPTAQKQIEASNLINQNAQLFQNAGGAQGGIGGLLTRLSALAPGSAAGQYQRSQGTTAALLGSLLGANPKSVAGLLPTFTENPATANTNLSTLYNLFNANPSLPATL